MTSTPDFSALDSATVQSLDAAGMARFIDHTQLAPTATRDDIIEAITIAKEHNTASVCIQPRWVSLAAEQLAGTEVGVCTVIGFPQGTTTTRTKAFEAADAVANGATEVDMVIHVPDALAHDEAALTADIAAVVEAATEKNPDVLVKVILETASLVTADGTQDAEAIRTGCRAAQAAGAHFVKTATGFGPGGATAEAVAIMREAVGDDLGVKASGGVRSFADAQAMLNAGATRLGASATLGILRSNITSPSERGA